MAENEGRDTDSRVRGDDLDDNVVRFPRDWFGPVEELTPIGPRADAQHRQSVEIEAPQLATADDFWGEGSAEIQQYVQAPAALGEVDRVASVERVVARPSRWWLTPRHVAMGAVAAVLIVMAVVGSVLGGAPGRKVARQSSQLSVIASLNGSADRVGRASVPVVGEGHGARHGRRPRSDRAATHRVAHVSRHGSSNAWSGGARSSGGSGRGTGSGSGTGSEATHPVQQTTPETVGQERPASTANSAGASAASAGPVGAGAPFGPGQMG